MCQMVDRLIVILHEGTPAARRRLWLGLFCPPLTCQDELEVTFNILTSPEHMLKMAGLMAFSAKFQRIE